MKKKIIKPVFTEKKVGPWTIRELYAVAPEVLRDTPLSMADLGSNVAAPVMRVGFHFDTNGKCQALLYRSPLS